MENKISAQKTEEENKNGIVVTKYINKENLSGKYSLYLQIDDTIYKTGKYIEGWY